MMIQTDRTVYYWQENDGTVVEEGQNRPLARTTTALVYLKSADQNLPQCLTFDMLLRRFTTTSVQKSKALQLDFYLYIQLMKILAIFSRTGRQLLFSRWIPDYKLPLVSRPDDEISPDELESHL